MKRIGKILFVSGLMLLVGGNLTSCSLDPKLENSVDNELSPIRTVAELEAGINGSYSRMKSATYYGRDIIIFSESRSAYMYGDGRTGRFDNVSGFNLQAIHSYTKDTWYQIYRMISNTNRVLEAELDIQDANVAFNKGQAYVLRALGHYDVLRIYGEQYVDEKGYDALGIPYIVKFAETNAKVSRGTVKETKEAIYRDLDQGIELLKQSGKGSTLKDRINLATAYALKSRIALFFAQFDRSQYNVVVENAQLSIEESNKSNISVIPRSGFLDSYKAEGIQQNSLFELAQSGVDNNGTASLFYIYNSFSNGGSYGDVRWIGNSKSIVFDEKEEDKVIDDIRSAVVTSDYQNQLRNTGKYTSRGSNIKMVRLEEVMFNYIEATLEGAGNGDAGLALNYLNEIVGQRVLLKKADDNNDAGVAKVYTSLDKEVVRKERTRELLFEGFGFEDLVRAKGVVKNPMSATNKLLVNGEVKHDDALTAFPIPQAEINVSKIEQNQAYR